MQTELFDTAQGLEMNKKLPEGYNREGLNARGWLRRVCGNNVNKRAIQSRWGVLNKSPNSYLVLIYEVTFWLILPSNKLT